MRETNNQTGWLSPAEVAEALGLTRKAVVAGRLRRALPWRKVSARCLRVRAVELERWLDAQRDGGRP